MDDNTTTPEPVAELAAGDTFLSLTGFDEIAIARTFAQPVTELRTQPMMFLRAMAFTDQRRKGLKDRDAYQLAMDLPFGDLQHYFPADDDAEDSPQGEDDGR